MIKGRPVTNDSKVELKSDEIMSFFDNYEIVDVLLEYDFPRVFSAKSPSNNFWIFKWCNYENDSKGKELWLAFQILESHLTSMKNGDTSLREVISLTKNNLHMYTCEDPFKPIEMKIVEYEEIPQECLPKNDISFKNGLPMTINERKLDQFGIRLHILTEEKRPLNYMQFPSTFHEYLSTTAHKINNTILYPSYDADDWSTMHVSKLYDGSFDFQCINKDPDKVTPLLKACELLAELVSGKSNLKLIKDKMGIDGYTHAMFLLELVNKFDLSLSLKWITEDKVNGFLALDKKRSKKILESTDIEDKKEIEKKQISEKKKSETTTTITIEMDEDQLQPIKRVTFKLSNEETEPIRRDVKGIGGMQNLIHELQDALKPDNTIVLTPAQITKILRYTETYGQGGFQSRLRGLARAIRRVGVSLS